MKKKSQLARDLYDVYCYTSVSAPVSFDEWWEDREFYDADYERRVEDDDVPGSKG